MLLFAATGGKFHETVAANIFLGDQYCVLAENDGYLAISPPCLQCRNDSSPKKVFTTTSFGKSDLKTNSWQKVGRDVTKAGKHCVSTHT